MINKIINETTQKIAESFEASKIQNSYKGLKFSLYRNGNNLRISEQEARFAMASVLEKNNIDYFIEKPTEETYCFKGKTNNKRSAQTDLALRIEGKIINIEFKALNPKKAEINKDIEKILKEKHDGLWFHLLKNVDLGTTKSLSDKFISVFKNNKQKLMDKIEKKEIMFCFYVLESRITYSGILKITCRAQYSKENISNFFIRLFGCPNNGFPII